MEMKRQVFSAETASHNVWRDGDCTQAFRRNELGNLLRVLLFKEELIIQPKVFDNTLLAVGFLHLLAEAHIAEED